MHVSTSVFWVLVVWGFFLTGCHFILQIFYSEEAKITHEVALTFISLFDCLEQF